MRLEPAIVNDILYLFGEGTFIFIRVKSGNFEKLCRQPCNRNFRNNSEACAGCMKHAMITPQARDKLQISYFSGCRE